MNYEIMNKWLEENSPNQKSNHYLVEDKNKIPLSYEEFIEWLMVHPNIKFSFNRYLGIYSDNDNIYLSIQLNEREIKYNERQDIHLDITIKIDNDIYNQLNQPIEYFYYYFAGKTYIQDYTNPSGVISQYCDSQLKTAYSTSGVNIDLMFKKVEKEWRDFAYNLFPFDKISYTSSEYGDFRRKEIEKSGLKLEVKLRIEYDDLSDDEIETILINRPNLDITITKHIDFGYYIMNVLSIKISRIIQTKTSPKYKQRTNISEQTFLSILIDTELIRPDDYYNTFAFYKTAWENICVNKKFSQKGLPQLAEELLIDDVDKYSYKDLCDIVGKRVENLQWSDFEA